MKILVMADSTVGENLVDWLLRNHREDIVCMVTTSVNAIYKTANSSGIPCHVYTDEVSFLAYWNSLKQTADYGFLLWWPRIVRKEILRVARKGFINTHPSLLPHNRGKHYNFWAIIEEVPFGVSLHFVEKGVDCGDIVAQEHISYGWEDTGSTLFHKAQAAMCKLFKTTYPLVKSGKYHRIPQNLEAGSFHFSKELETASYIELNKIYTGKQLLNLLRARTFDGTPACRFNDGGTEYEVRVQIKKAKNFK